MELRQIVVSCAIVSGVAGCASPVPVATNFPISTQKVARTAHHWDVVADDVITQTLASIENKPELQRRAIVIDSDAPSTTFDRAFRNFMITRLVDKGLPVNVCRTAAQTSTGFSQPPGLPPVNVQYETQIVQHRGRMPVYRPGALTWLAGNIAAIYNLSVVDHSRDFIGGAAAGLVILNDVIAGHAAAPTRTELILTTTITEDNRYIMRKNDVYYIPDADAALFMKQISQRSPCPSTKVAAAELSPPYAKDPVATEESLRAMLTASMRRSNQDWRPDDNEFYSGSQDF